MIYKKYCFDMGKILEKADIQIKLYFPFDKDCNTHEK